jgi:outer membrane protein insertion porin family
MRGFDIRGIGPRIIRRSFSEPNVVGEDSKELSSDALGGRAYYMGRIELEFPTSASLKSFGLRPSAFVDIGSVWGLKKPNLNPVGGICNPPPPPAGGTAQPVQILEPGETSCDPGFTYVANSGYGEFFTGNSPKPRLSVGIGVNWVSPFGPLRIDIAKALLTQEGDDTKLFSFNVGTQF